MPTTFYSEDEYLALLKEKRDLERQVAGLEQLRPVWALGFTSDGRAAAGYASALSSVWQELGVTDQTQAMQKLRALCTTQPADGAAVER